MSAARPHRGRRPGAASLVCLALLCLLGVLGTAAPAAAHGVLVRSDPQDGGMVAEGRTRLTLWFAEPVDLRGSRFLLHTADGGPVDVTASISPDGEGVVELTTAALDRGVYVLDWSTLSTADGHVTDGSLLFGAGVRPDVAPASGSTWPGWAALLSRWLALAGLLVAVGAVAVTGRVLDAARLPASGAVRRAALLGAAAAAASVVGALGEALLRTPRAAEGTGSWLAAVVDNIIGSRWGQLWSWHVVALVLASGLLAAAASGRIRLPPSRAAAAGLLVVAATTEVLAGHVAGTGGTLAEIVGVLATSAHLLAAGAWLGGLVVLAACLLPVAQRTPGRRRLLLHGAWRAFSPVAAASALLVLASGMLLLGRDLPDLSALSDTTWGLAATGKVAALVAVLGIAAFSTLAVHPRSEDWLGRAPERVRALPAAARARFPHLVGAELVCLAAAVVLAALMTSVATAEQQRDVEATPTARTATVDGLFVSLEQVPLSSRESRVVLRINPLVRPQPGPVTGSDVMLVGPDAGATTVTLAEVEEGHWEATAPTPGAGRWTAWIAVERRGAPDAVASVTWTAPDHPGSGPYATTGLVLAVLLLAGGGAAALVVRRRRPRAAAHVTADDRTARPQEAAR